jgi:hypothetical protein
MKNQNAIVVTRIPRDLVKGLKRIEAAEHTDRSTTVRNLLRQAMQHWDLDWQVPIANFSLILTRFE